MIMAIYRMFMAAAAVAGKASSYPHRVVRNLQTHCAFTYMLGVYIV